MEKARGSVLLTDRHELQMAKDFDGNLADAAWRGLIWQDGKELWHGHAHWTRSAAWEEMFIANEENGWAAVLKAPLEDEAPV